MPFRTVVILSALLLVVLLAGGCAMLGLQEDLQVLAQTSRIEGTVTAVPMPEKPVCILLLTDEDGSDRKTLASHQIIYPPDKFHFVRRPGEYYLLVFEDANEDMTWQSEERVGWYGDPTPVKVSGCGAEISGLTIALRPADEARRELPQLYAPAVPKISLETTAGYLHRGELAQLDDPRFAPDAGVLGMWEPVKFLEQYGAGVFFLEPYSRGKIPVLFVHGVGGSPQDFRFLIDQLDHSRVQPWIFHYPSGLRLAMIAELLAKDLRELKLRHGFARMDVVAHSMGGLVARDAINQLTRQGATFIETFVSISSPWRGHPGAQVGMEHSPVILPCWYDMAPGSPFLKALQQTPLPKGTTYALFFGHKGDSALFAGESSDDTLPLSSMADLDMQDAASKVLVFNESHCGILSSPEVARRLNRVLAASAAGEGMDAGAPAAAVTTALPGSVFDRVLELQGIRFHVTSAGNGSINTLRIVPSGLAIDNTPIERTIDGTVTGAEIADINADGSPEIYLYVTSAGSGSYGSLVAYSANRRKSLSEIHLPPVTQDAALAKGYMGHDEFAVIEGGLAQRFPVFRDTDTNARPTGGTRQLQHKLVPGEAGWVLKVDRVVEY